MSPICQYIFIAWKTLSTRVGKRSGMLNQGEFESADSLVARRYMGKV